LSNAVKYTSEGEIKIVAKLHDENIVIISVEDTGCGLSKDNQKTIFK
jgi:signal transduction histidine kinase